MSAAGKPGAPGLTETTEALADVTRELTARTEALALMLADRPTLTLESDLVREELLLLARDVAVLVFLVHGDPEND